MTFICGLDEAGRGPLAGPVTAAAVFLPENFPIHILNDSKKLSEKKRAAAEAVIKEQSLAWAVYSVDEKDIDRINILQASLLAMKFSFEKAFDILYCSVLRKREKTAPAEERRDFSIHCIADGNKIPDIRDMRNIHIFCEARVKADACVPAVMAASVLAKTERDRIMKAYAKLYPEYGYERHKGYPTAEHRALCRKLGPSPIQRMSFSY